MEKPDDLTLAVYAKGDVDLARLVVEERSNLSEPKEPDFLPPQNQEEHEPSLGTLTRVQKRLYLLYVKTADTLNKYPNNGLLIRQHNQMRRLFCQEIRHSFNLNPFYDRVFVVCKGWQLCLAIKAKYDDVNHDSGDSVEISYLVGLTATPERRVVRATPSRFVSDMM